jgi:hypothetical protein
MLLFAMMNILCIFLLVWQQDAQALRGVASMFEDNNYRAVKLTPLSEKLSEEESEEENEKKSN